MKKPFTLLTAAACLSAFMSFVPAAPGQAPDAMAKLETLSKELQLTPQQKGEMLPILKEEGPKLEAIKSNTSLSGMQKMRQLRAIHNENAPQLQKILNSGPVSKAAGHSSAGNPGSDREKARGKLSPTHVSCTLPAAFRHLVEFRDAIDIFGVRLARCNRGDELVFGHTLLEVCV